MAVVADHSPVTCIMMFHAASCDERHQCGASMITAGGNAAVAWDNSRGSCPQSMRCPAGHARLATCRRWMVWDKRRQGTHLQEVVPTQQRQLCRYGPT